MNTTVKDTQEYRSQSVDNEVAQVESSVSTQTLQFADFRPQATIQRKLQSLADHRSQTGQAAQMKAMAERHPNQSVKTIQKKGNTSGLPNQLKTGIEHISGYSMDDVTVHYNSKKPAQLQAHAYAQGSDIHLAPRQEKHLAHEAWHVVQQKQGRVKPTLQLKGKINVNTDSRLEKEADVMGQRALDQVQYRSPQSINTSSLRYTTENSPVQLAKAQYVNGTVVADIYGTRDRTKNATNRYTAHKAVKAGKYDYIKATHYDGAHHTPSYEFINQFNTYFKDEDTGLVAPNDTVPKLTLNKIFLSSPLNATFRRPFSVEARTSAARGKGRSNTSGIETNVGRMGNDESMIREGQHWLMQGGHLVGDQIMDSHGSFLLYEDWNLAPQDMGFNAPMYLTTMENAARDAINNGADIKYTVNVQYPDNTYREKASDLAKRATLWNGGNYGTLITAAITNGTADRNFTFTRRTPGYWKTKMEDLGQNQVIASTLKDSGLGHYDGTTAAVAAGKDYNPPFLENFRYTAKADGLVLGALAAGNQWDVSDADSLELTTRQRTP